LGASLDDPISLDLMRYNAVGIILISALIVILAAAAYQLTEDFRRMMILAVIKRLSPSWVGS
jgi:ABC-type Mn2+/Zn2+ transport system permease subunit